MLREAGVNWSNIGRLTQERPQWKKIVKDRMEHLKQWEWSKGHSWQGDPLQRATKEEAKKDGWECEVCEKICKSKAGLTVHRRRMHEVSTMKRKFSCDSCDEEFSQEANLKNHTKKCVGGEPAPPRVYKGKTKPCPECGKVLSATNMSRHLREACKGGGVNP